VRIRVSDTGRGVPPEKIHKIFEKYYQVEEKVSSKKGSGLGLAISKAIIEAHGGRIWAQPRKGQGTDFYMEIPA